MLRIMCPMANNRAHGRGVKIMGPVSFPVRALDVCELLLSEREGPVYDLVSVVNHHGSSFSGHYTADARSPVEGLGWFHFNDSHVRRLANGRLDAAGAYLLFYEQR